MQLKFSKLRWMTVLVIGLGFANLNVSGCPPPPKMVMVHTAVKGVVPGLDFSDEIWHGDTFVGASDLVETNKGKDVETFYYNGVTHYSMECGSAEPYGVRHFVYTKAQGSKVYVGPGAAFADDHSNLTLWGCDEGQGSLDPDGVRWVNVDSNCHVTPVCKTVWAQNGGPNPPADDFQTITTLGLYVENPGPGWMPYSDGDFGLGGSDYDCDPAAYSGRCFGGANVRGSGAFTGCFQAYSSEESMPLAGMEVGVKSFATLTQVPYVTGEDGCVTVWTDGYLNVLPQP